MNYCTACGAELIQGADFCSKCGTRTVLNTQAGEPSQEERSTDYSVDETKEKVTAALSSAKTSLEKSSYFNYFKATAKNPSKDIEAEGYNGWIHLTLLALVTAFATYAFVSTSIKVVSATDFYFGFGIRIFDTYIKELLWDAFIQVFVVSFILYLVFMLLIYLLLNKLAGQIQLSFQKVLNSASAIFTPLILLFFLSSLFTLIFSSDLTLNFLFIVLLFAVIYYFLAFNYIVTQGIDTLGWNELYVVSGSNLLILGVFAYFYVLQFQPLIEGYL